MRHESTPAGESDGELVRSIAGLPPGQARSQEAELVARFSRPVYLFGRRHLGDHALAADLVQDVMERTIERLRAGEVREPDRLGSFVLGMARTMATDGARRNRKQEQLAVALAREAEPAVHAPNDRPDAARLQPCLAALSERERTVVLLTFHGGDTAAEIARAIGTSDGNVRVLRHRAIGKLQRCMGLEVDP